MIGKIIGGLVGREIDRREGGSGARGVLLGVIVAGGMRRLGPLGLVLGGAYVAKKSLDRARDARRPS